MKLFGYGILAGFLAVVGGLATVFVGMPLVAPDSAPAPPITKLVHLDEKLRFVREHPEIDPTLLAIGSSVTWRQISGEAFEAFSGGPHRFLNGGTGYLQIHQTRALARFYLSRYPRVGTLLVMTSLGDFRDCTNEPANLFEPQDAARYAFGGWPPLYFHLRYFSPGRYAKTVMTLKGRKAPLTGDLYNDRYGSGAIDLPDDVDLGLRYGKFESDPACIEELIALAQDMDSRNIRLALVFTPFHPEYRTRYPDEVDRLTGIASRLAREERRIGEDLTVVNFIRDPSFEAEDFYDALHLQWPAVKRLSARIAQEMGAASHAPEDEDKELITQSAEVP